MKKTQKLVIFGTTEFAEIAYEYFTWDSEYEVSGFCIDAAYRDKDTLFGLPVVDFETVENHFPPSTHFFYSALVYTLMNRLRARTLSDAKQKGYRPASYISSNSFVWRNVEMGEHVFIFEDNTIQPFVKVGNNVVMWSGNHIGHHSVIKDHVFISSHVVVSGKVTIGENCFLGVNATVNNAVTVGKDCFLASGALVIKDVPEDRMVKGKETSDQSVRAMFKVS